MPRLPSLTRPCEIAGPVLSLPLMISSGVLVWAGPEGLQPLRSLAQFGYRCGLQV